MVAVDPFDQTLVKQGGAQEVKVETAMDVTIQTGDHELSLAEFLDGCARVVNRYATSEVVRSTLEDFSGQTEASVHENNQKTIKIHPTFPPVPTVKHGKN